MKLQKREIYEDYKEIPFTWLTQEYGKAEFVFCPVVRNNKIRRVLIYPKQQPGAKEYFIITNEDGWEGIDFGVLLVNSQLSHPIIWKTYFCKKHKSYSIQMYVPKNSKAFFITTGLGNFCINWR